MGPITEMAADTLGARIQFAIDQQQREVDRLTAAATVDLPAAEQQLNRLQAMLTKDTAPVENFFQMLFAAGIVK